MRELAPEGQWLLGCAPGVDDRSRPVLWIPANAENSPRELLLDRLLGTSPRGRFVAFERSGGVFLFDAERGEELPLPSDERPPLLAAFSSEETTLVLLESGGSRLSLLELTNASELSASRRRVNLERPVYSIETTPRGFALRWTDRASPRYSSEYCAREGFPAFPTGKLGALRAHRDTWLLDEGDPSPRAAPGFLGGTEAFELFRTEAGALLARRPERTLELSPESCGGRVLAGSDDGARFVVVCEEYRLGPSPAPKAGVAKRPTKPKLRFPLFFVGPSGSTPLDAQTMRTGTDTFTPGARFAAIRLGAQPTLLDLEEGKLVPLPSGHVALSTHAGFALLRQGKNLLRYPKAWDDEHVRALAPLERLLTAGPYFASRGLFGSLDGAFEALPPDESPLLLSERGFLLGHRTAEGTYSLRKLERAGPPRVTDAR